MDAPPPPQSPPPVNWDALDALVLDFARSDCLVLPPTSPSSPSSPSSSSTTTATSSSVPSSSSSYRSRLLILRARRALEEGDVDATLALLRSHAPAALLDYRLLFHLHKQRFVELVRRGTETDREAALDCLRTALAPCALDAYPGEVVLMEPSTDDATLMADKRAMEQVACAAPSLVAEAEAQGGGEGEVSIGQTLAKLPLPQAASALKKATVDAHMATPTVETLSWVESLCAVIPATPNEAAFLKIHNGALDPAVRSFPNSTDDNRAKPAP
ncbi:hypothetical protein GUJ93_ZPchr0012g19796 [Zizania palustris]|uniref:CTLH domain-containing protein n=1 Tax=Zizania palustris TaxID=103762 RepID=A0A8J5WKM6_ZIZPA|nr:hypothetical protein GUJ93_ZPchr0012g19796 [Zizania palustris]